MVSAVRPCAAGGGDWPVSMRQRGGTEIRLLRNGEACVPGISETMLGRREVWIGFEGYGRGRKR
jgi:hypothetical protein